jgi:hypothetical protein
MPSHVISKLEVNELYYENEYLAAKLRKTEPSLNISQECER